MSNYRNTIYSIDKLTNVSSFKHKTKQKIKKFLNYVVDVVFMIFIFKLVNFF